MGTGKVIPFRVPFRQTLTDDAREAWDKSLAAVIKEQQKEKRKILLSDREHKQHLLSAFSLLSKAGKARAVMLVNELTHLPQYTSESEQDKRL